MEFVELKVGSNGALTVPVDVFVFAHALDRRGITMRVDGDKLRVSGPQDQKPELSPSDVSSIKKWKPHLMALAAYVAPDPPL